jgi:hypothetical protein
MSFHAHSWKEFWSASTATATGCCTMALTRSGSELTVTSVYDLTEATALHFLHVPSAAVYGYDASEQMPLDSIHLKAESIRPPLQPWLPAEPEQSTSSCSDSDGSVPVAMNVAPSSAPVVENAQHEPHWPAGARRMRGKGAW